MEDIESIDSSQMEEDDFKIDVDDMIKSSEGSRNSFHNPQRQVNNAFSQYGTTLDILGNGLSMNSENLCLRPDFERNNSITNDLFQITNRNRDTSINNRNDLFNTVPHKDTIRSDESTKNRLLNDKIDKLVHELGLKNFENEEYALDDQVRTRIFKGRFKSKVNEDVTNELGIELNNYLRNSTGQRGSNYENKENVTPYSDSTTLTKKNSKGSIKKSNKIFFRSPRMKGNKIPVLKSITNTPNFGKSSAIQDLNKCISTSSPKRICSPKHKKNLAPQRSSLKHSGNGSLNIFLVDASTGLLSDATQFGTELNASNCEGFPLPENSNEIVQIPTNDESPKKRPKKSPVPKMAIIKAYQDKSFAKHSTDSKLTNRLGFYNKEQYKEYRQNVCSYDGNVVHEQRFDSDTSASQLSDQSTCLNKDKQSQKKIRWADELEW